MIQDHGESRDPIDWFVVLGDDLKTPMIENVDWLDEEEAETMMLVFDWVEAYLEHDGYEDTLERLVGRGLSEEDSRRLMGYVLEERLPRETRRVESIGVVSELPEDRQAMEVLEGGDNSR